MKRLSKVNKADWGLVPVNPDPDFSEEHNRKVIEETIKMADAKRAEQMKQFKDDVAERTHAASMYLKNLDHGQGVSDITEYFGKEELARLRGEKRISILKQNIAYRNSQGKLTKRAGDV